MRIAFRADGSPTQGTGHVMRCVTLATAAREMGHEPLLVTNDTGVTWLEQYLLDTGLPLKRVSAGELALSQFLDFAPDRVLIDSYVYTDEQIADVSARIHTAVVVDFNTRTAPAALYIDPNLGAVAREPHSAEWLVGSNFAIIRPAVLAHRGPCGANFDTENPRILVFVGGSDPFGLTASVVNAVAAEVPHGKVIAIGGSKARADIAIEMLDNGRVVVVEPGSDLPQLLGEADVIVCAAGTSAWDVSAIGKPAVFLGVVDNQMVSIENIRQHDLGPVIDATRISGKQLSAATRSGIREILDDSGLRSKRVQRMTELFDGRGAQRIINALVKQ